MAIRIKLGFTGPSHMDQLIKSRLKPTIERQIDAAQKDFSESVSSALQAGQSALNTLTPASVFPYAENAPARRKTGAMYKNFKRKTVRNSKKEGVFIAEIGWRPDSAYEEYFKYQEEGFNHVHGRFVRGVEALTYAEQAYIQDMKRRGY